MAKSLSNSDKFYGNAVVGSKGQIVIPAEARKDMKIRPGDQLIVIGKINQGLGLIKAEQLNALLKKLQTLIK